MLAGDKLEIMYLHERHPTGAGLSAKQQTAYFKSAPRLRLVAIRNSSRHTLDHVVGEAYRNIFAGDLPHVGFRNCGSKHTWAAF